VSRWLPSRGEGPRLRISQSLGAFRLPGGDVSPLYVLFTVSNPGPETATLTSARVLPSRGEGPAVHVGEGDHPLPGPLEPGGSARLWLRAKALAKAMKDAEYGGRTRLVFVVEDDRGALHRKTFTFRVDEYLQLKDD
jgi:hypothetical protein